MHVVVGGDIGGAERLLVDLAGRPDQTRSDHEVALFTSNPSLAAYLVGAGLRVHPCGDAPETSRYRCSAKESKAWKWSRTISACGRSRRSRSSPDIYAYSFVADGVQMTDPANPLLKYNLLNTVSQVHVPGPQSLPWEINDVPRGTLHHHFYKSQAAADERRLLGLYAARAMTPRRGRATPCSICCTGTATMPAHGFQRGWPT